MIVIEDRRFALFRDRTLFFPTADGVAQALEDVDANGIVRISQTSTDIADHPKLIRRKLSRTNCLDLSKDLDELLAEMDPKSCRYEIRRAEKMLPRIRVRLNDRIAYRDFQSLYNNFVKTKRFAPQLSDRRLRMFSEVSDVFVIYLDERAMCGHLLLRDEKARRVRLCFSATNRLDSSEDAALSGSLNRFLHWREIQNYHERAFELYDFGGTEAAFNNIARFKLSFGGFELLEHCYVFMGDLAGQLYALYKNLSPLAAARFRRRGDLI